MMRVFTAFILLFSFPFFLNCGDDLTGRGPEIRIDESLSVPVSLGSAPVVVGSLKNCDATPDIRAYALAHNDRILVGHDAQADEILIDTPQGAKKVFQLPLDENALNPHVFGLPIRLPIIVETICHAMVIESPTFEFLFLPTASSILSPSTSARFWAGDNIGDLWICNDHNLELYADGVTLVGSIDVGFSCSLAEVEGLVGQRRYVISEHNGIAAIDPGPVLAWNRLLDIDAYRISDTGDISLVLSDAGSTSLLSLDPASGADQFAPVFSVQKIVGRPQRSGALIRVLTATRQTLPVGLTYEVQSYDTSGTLLNNQIVAYYGWQAPSYVADFSNDGQSIYVTAAPTDEENVWVEKIDLATQTTVWGTSPEEPWRFALAEVLDRVLVASDDGFGWLDPDNGTSLTGVFGPDSSNRFLRANVEDDGSLVLLADHQGSVAQGLYMFSPEGSPIVRLHHNSTLFRWLTPAWGSGTLVGFFDEIHLLDPTNTYAAQLP